MTTVLAIDPGTKACGVVRLLGSGTPKSPNVLTPDDTLKWLGVWKQVQAFDHLAIEMVASYGMAVGKDVFETCVLIGRIIEAWGGPYTKVYRKDVKLHLCGSSRAKDANIRQAIIDRYPATGGGKTPQIGTKSNPGPLYGVKSHAWAALAVGLTWMDKHNTTRASTCA